ncbi:MAG: hypothetical protein ABI034_09540 [Nakamurella sp.]
MGWLDDLVTDHDTYDDTDHTLYLVRSADAPNEVPSPTIRAGLRITQVGSFYESLTWNMLASNAGNQADIISNNFALISDINRQAVESAVGLWDITRLVCPLDDSVSKLEVIQSIYELLGMAMYKTVVEPDADPVWMFLTTPTMKRLFEMSGIECTVLFAGHVTDTDDYDSFLCVARPRSAYMSVRNSHRTATKRVLTRVLDGCNALQSQHLATTRASTAMPVVDAVR